MNKLFLLPFCLLSLGALLIGVISATTEGTLDCSDLASVLDHLGQELRLERELEAAHQATRARMDRREWLTTELVAGRMSLLDVAAEFQALNESAIVPARRLNMVFPAASEGEAVCKQVISWAYHSCLDHSGPDADATRAWLEAELQYLLEREGTITLPRPARESDTPHAFGQRPSFRATDRIPG